MARFESGWIKFYRRAWQEDIGSNIYCLCVWVALLSMAHWKESKIVWEGKQRTLPPGSVVFGIKELSDRWECSRSVVKKWLHYLNDTGRIVLETCPRGCIATICNWEIYQNGEDESCSPQDHGVSAARHQRDNNAPLIEEVKKEEINNSWFELALAEYKKFKNVTKGGNAESRFRDQVKTEEAFQSVLESIKNYRIFLGRKENEWRKPKVSFENFLGTKRSGFFWREFLLPVSGQSGQTHPKVLGTLEDLIGGQKNAS